MLGKIVRKAANLCGYELLDRKSSFAADRSLAGLLQNENINLVLDVGANRGQFAKGIRKRGYKGRIISFEPLASAHKLLTSRAKRDPSWKVAERTAIGSENGSTEIHVSGNSVSSSILGMLPAHSKAEPKSAYVSTEPVPINCLDDICALGAGDRVLLKIDVQGYETEVLKGAQRILKSCRAVVLEMSFIQLYQGQALAMEMWGNMERLGFMPWSFEPGFRHPISGQLLQVDGYFTRY